MPFSRGYPSFIMAMSGLPAVPMTPIIARLSQIANKLRLNNCNTLRQSNVGMLSVEAPTHSNTEPYEQFNASTHSIALERASEEETLYYVLSKDGTSAQVSLPCSAQPVLSEPMQADLVQLDPLTWLIPPMTAVLFEREDPLCAP